MLKKIHNYKKIFIARKKYVTMTKFSLLEKLHGHKEKIIKL